MISTSTSLNLNQIELGEPTGFDGYMRSLRVWGVWLDVAQFTSFARVSLISSPGLIAEWDFSSHISTNPSYLLSPNTACYTSLPESQIPLTCPSLQVYATLNGGTGLLDCTNACPSNCDVCTNTQCMMCDDLTFMTSTGCSAQTDLELDALSQTLMWNIPTATWSYSAATVMMWVKPKVGSAGPMMHLYHSINTLDVNVNAGVLSVSQAGTTIGNCAAASDTWLHVAITFDTTSPTIL